MNQAKAAVSEPSDWINPVAVKEFRQAVQSRWVVAVLMLFLLLNLTIIGGYLLLSPDVHTDTEGGQGVFVALLSILVFTCFGFVPAYTGIRLSLERHSTDIDLFFITTITPGAIVRGKYLAAMALTLLIFSTCMPFMVLTYLLRGIDLPTIFLILAGCFVVCAAANAMGLFAGAVSGGWIIRGLVAAGVIIFMFQISVAMLGTVQGLMFFGPGLWGHGWEVWAGVGTFLLVELLGIGLLYVFAVALLSARPANRMMVPRLYLTGCWAVTGCVALLWSHVHLTMEPVTGWAVMSVIATCILVVAVTGERDTWSVRVRRTIPRNPLPRLGAFLTYTGSAGGLLWYTMLFAATMLVLHGWHALMSGFAGASDVSDVFRGSLIGFGFVLCYCLTIAALRPVLFRNAPTPHLSVFVMFFGMAMCLVPYLVAFFIEQNWWLAEPWYFLVSPLILTVMRTNLMETAEWIVIGWLILSTMAAAPWAVGQWRRFTPHRAAEPEPVPTAVPHQDDLAT